MKTKLSLGFFPTPIYALKNLAKLFDGYRIYIKRDDHNGVATGGNKIRKLEYLLQDALDQGCDTVITAGAQQSNHCRLTAAACAQTRLKCHLLLGGERPEQYDGNLLLSHLLGAQIHFTGNNRKGEDIPVLEEALKKEGARPYVVPYGGSNRIGALGYVDFMRELKNQMEADNIAIDYLVFPSSSGGTHAGLIAGSELYDFKGQLTGISIDKEKTNDRTLEEIIAGLVSEVLELYDGKKVDRKVAIDLNRDYDQAGYGVITENEKRAIELLARTEGILLDPVYTARAFYGMIDLMEKKVFKAGSGILFLHTGGIPANFCYAKELTPII